MAEPMIQSGPASVDPSQSRSAASPDAAPGSNPIKDSFINGLGLAFDNGNTAAVSAPESPVEREIKQAAQDQVQQKAPGTKDVPPAKTGLPPLKDSKSAEIDFENMPPDKWPRNAQQWKEYKEAASKSIKERDAKISELNKRTPQPSESPELAEIIKERDTYKNELKAIAIERDPEFRAKYDNAEAVIKTNLEAFLGDDSEKAMEIFARKHGKSRTNALEKFTEELSGLKQNVVTQALLEYDKVNMARSLELDTAKKNWEKIQLERSTMAQDSERTQTRTFESAFEQVVNQWTDKENGFELTRKTGDKDHDSQVDNTIAIAREILTGKNTPDEVARAAMYAAITPLAYQALQSANEKIADLEKQLTSYKSSYPGIGSDMGRPGSTEQNLPEGVSFGERMAAGIAQLGLMR